MNSTKKNRVLVDKLPELDENIIIDEDSEWCTQYKTLLQDVNEQVNESY